MENIAKGFLKGLKAYLEIFKLLRGLITHFRWFLNGLCRAFRRCPGGSFRAFVRLFLGIGARVEVPDGFEPLIETFDLFFVVHPA